MRTRFSDLVFSYWGNSAASAHLPVLVLVPHPGATILPPPVHARATSRPAYPLSPAAAPALGAPSEPLFHHAVSKRPDHQLHAIMCPRLCHGGR